MSDGCGVTGKAVLMDSDGHVDTAPAGFICTFAKHSLKGQFSG